MNGKGWPPEVLRRFGVTASGRTFTFPNGEVYDPDGEQKMDAPKGKQRGLWPDPADLPGDEILVVEGRADVLSAAELGYVAVSVPSARPLRDDEAARIARGRTCTFPVADCDSTGRRCARQWAERIAAYGPAALVDLAPDRHDGFDIGDLLIEARHFNPERGDDGARRWLAHVLEQAEPIVARAGLQDGATFALGAAAHVEAVWGRGSSVLWAEGEPLLIVAPDGAGKTTLAQQLALRRAGIGDAELLGYPLAPGKRVLYVAADRPRQAARSMRRMVGFEDREALAGRLLVWRGGLPFNLVREPGRLAEWCVDMDADLIVLDSVKDVLDRPGEEESGLAFNAAAGAVMAAGVELIGLHHQRKAQTENKRPKTIADVYGSRWLTACCGSVLLLWGDAGDPIVELRHLKPADDAVGPLTLLHDHDKGTTTVLDAPDLLTIVGEIGEATATQVAAALFGKSKPGRADVERARRRLDVEAEAGRLERIEPEGSGRGHAVVWKVTGHVTPITQDPPPEGTPDPPFKGGRDWPVTDDDTHVTRQQEYMRYEARRQGERDEDDEP